MKKSLTIIGILLFVALAAYVCVRFVQARSFRVPGEAKVELTQLSPRASYLSGVYYLRTDVAPHLEQLILAAEKDGMCLIVKAGYRTKEHQQKLYDNAKNKSIVALPGISEHEQGIAVDFDACPMIDGVRNDSGERLELRNEFVTLPEYQWLLKNASRYGFAQSYTEDNRVQTGLPPEPWHWKYIGL